MRFRKILVPLAPHQRIGARINEILSMADEHDSAVVFLSVIDDLSGQTIFPNYHYSNTELLDIAEQLQRDHLTRLYCRAQTFFPHIDFTIKVAVGRPFECIIKASHELDCDLIVVNANRGHKRSVFQFGSTTRHLMRKSEVPIWTLPRKKTPEKAALVMAVDVSKDNPENLGLNRKIIDYGMTIAAQRDLVPVLVHAWKLYGEGYLKRWHKSKPADIASLARAEQDMRKSLCLELVQGHDIEVQLLNGIAEQAVPDFVRRRHAQILVMGTLCRSGLPGVIIGNTAESVLDSVDCSVLTIKPDKFVSPVLNDQVAA